LEPTPGQWGRAPPQQAIFAHPATGKAPLAIPPYPQRSSRPRTRAQRNPAAAATTNPAALWSIAQHSHPDRKRHRHPSQYHDAQQRKAPQRKPARNTSQDRPRQRVRNPQPHIPQFARVPRRSSPPQLVITKPPKIVIRHRRLYHFAAQLHQIAGLRDARAYLVIIRQILDQRLQPARLRQRSLRHRQCRPKTKTNAVLQPSRRQHSRQKVGRDSQRLQPGPHRHRRPTLRRPANVRSRHHPHPPIRKTLHHQQQIVGRHANVAVVDQDIVIPRLAQHLHQVCSPCPKSPAVHGTPPAVSRTQETPPAAARSPPPQDRPDCSPPKMISKLPAYFCRQ